MRFSDVNNLAASICGMKQVTKPAKKPLRPTDRDMLQAIADAYGVSARQAHAWWYTVDFDSVADELCDEERAHDRAECEA